MSRHFKTKCLKQIVYMLGCLMDTKKLAERLKKFKGRYREIANETGMSYATVRLIACERLLFPKKETVAPLLEWMKGRKP